MGSHALMRELDSLFILLGGEVVDTCLVERGNKLFFLVRIFEPLGG
jgi:hypothetical protein